MLYDETLFNNLNKVRTENNQLDLSFTEVAAAPRTGHAESIANL